ncbi:hypothetical protein OG203_17345 [Nocardia sp. NBC_01499]
MPGLAAVRTGGRATSRKGAERRVLEHPGLVLDQLDVMSAQDGSYKVDVFVNVSSTNAQSPDGAQTTVTYNVTLDENSGWKITDVGGVGGALPLK